MCNKNLKLIYCKNVKVRLFEKNNNINPKQKAKGKEKRKKKKKKLGKGTLI